MTDWFDRYLPQTQGEWRAMESDGEPVMQMETALEPERWKLCKGCPKRFRQRLREGRPGFNARQFCTPKCAEEYRERYGVACTEPAEPKRSKSGRRLLSPMAQEHPACKTAIIQALRFHFHQRVVEIAALMNVPPQTVSSLTVGTDSLVLPWHARKHQAAAIEQAGKLLKGAAS